MSGYSKTHWESSDSSVDIPKNEGSEKGSDDSGKFYE